MVFSYYLTSPLYCAAWRVVRLFRKGNKIILYCEDAFDALLFRNVQKHLKPVPLVAKNKKVKQNLRALGFTSTTMPSFPDVVIMFRNAAWKFPCKQIIKIGFEHGAYNFKRFSKTGYYDFFTVFFMTSEADLARARNRGITIAKAVGFPKIDAAVDGSITRAQLDELSGRLGLDPSKKTLLFSSTWDGSGMSAIDTWYNRVGELNDRYNLLVTVHSQMSESYRRALQANPHITFITDYELFLPIMLSDVCLGDTNSLIAEFCLFDKPIITFRVPPTSRTMPDVMELIESVSYRIDTFEELEPAIERVLRNPSEKSIQRKQAVQTFLGNPDGKAGLRAAGEIITIVPELRQEAQRTPGDR
jgi:hypothetical protein